MANSIRTILYPVSDLDAAKRFIAIVAGTDPEIDSPQYVHFRLDGQEVGLVPKTYANGMTGATPYWHVDDIRATVDRLRAAGGTVQQEPNDVGGGRLVALVADADGNQIGVIQDTRNANQD